MSATRSAFRRILRARLLPVTVSIRWYQRRIAPFMPAGCPQVPSCSEYMARAVETRGLIAGVATGLRRLWRCGNSAAAPDPHHRGIHHGHLLQS